MKAGVMITTNLLFKIIIFVIIMVIATLLILFLRGKSLDAFEFIKQIIEIAF